jgi:hypothetical protein
MTIRNKTCIDILRFKKNNPLIFGLVTLYLVFLTIYSLIFLTSYADHNKAMELNELGDFLAGSFSPLAFLFLYLGYKQQGTELKQNTNALKLQAEELKNSVEQQTELVKTAKEELDLTIKQMNKNNKLQLIQAQPFFHINDLKVRIEKYSDSELNHYHLNIGFNLKNSRAMCRSLWFSYSFDEDDPIYLLQGTSLEIIGNELNTAQHVSVYTKHQNERLNAAQLTIFFQLNYTDEYDTPQKQTIRIQANVNAYSFPLEHSYQWLEKSFIG